MNIWENFWLFIDKGGDVLLIIFAVAVLLWAFIFEKFYFLKQVAPGLISEKLEAWKSQSDRGSWWALRVREAHIADIREKMSERIGMIKTIVVLCPLLGLLGTVTGMMVVFDVMAVSGANARMMASGISMATIPTMAGMVVALSGIYLGSLIEKKVELISDSLGEKFEVTA